MKRIYSVKTPAKINIGLRVLSKRKDGFHNIETIFYPVKLYDKISLKITKTDHRTNFISVETAGTFNISSKKNLCYIAAEKYLEMFKPDGKYRIDISIKKVIPAGAGLGGGSSDAASVMNILHKHFRKTGHTLRGKMNNYNTLNKLASEIGSDVPFFLVSKPAYATGKGEKLKLLPEFRIKGRILIVNPGIHISTPLAYRELKVKNRKPAILKGIKNFDSKDKRLMINDFEKVVFNDHPAIELLKYEMLSQGAEFALMSGSGSTVYGIFAKSKFNKAVNFFRKKYAKVFAV